MKLLPLFVFVLFVISSSAGSADLIFRAKLDEDPASHGTTIADSSSNGHNGTLITNNGATNKSVTGAFGGSKGISFDGIDDRISVGLGSDLPIGAAARTLTAWVNPAELGDRKFLSYGGIAAGTIFSFTVEDVSGPHVLFRHGSGNIRYSGASLNDWFHFAALVPAGAATTDDVRVFIDGVEQVGTRNNGSDLSLNTGSSDLAIGRHDGSVSYFNGRIDDVQLYDEALSDSQISSLFNNPGSTAEAVPEPTTLAIWSVLGCVGLAVSYRRHKRIGRVHSATS